MNTYSVYGLRLASAWPLAGYRRDHGPPDLTLVEGSVRLTRAGAAHPPGSPAEEWPRYERLPDGSIFLRWGSAFEFLIDPAGETIEGRAGAAADLEGFQAYLLGQVLSFVLIHRGREPLHASAVSTPCGAVAFLGGSGIGKSTLAAEFVRAGAALLTDDLLVTRDRGGRELVLPGPPRLKLFPEDPDAAGGRMNPHTEKRLVAVEAAAPLPLRAIYLLAPRAEPRSGRVIVRRMPGPAAFRALMAATYNNFVETPARLVTQFGGLTRLAARVPVSLLSYPRTRQALARVRERILADACR